MSHKKSQTQMPSKKKYTSPKLIPYGNIVDMTKGGSIGNSEPNGGPSASDPLRFA